MFLSESINEFSRFKLSNFISNPSVKGKLKFIDPLRSELEKSNFNPFFVGYMFRFTSNKANGPSLKSLISRSSERKLENCSFLAGFVKRKNQITANKSILNFLDTYLNK
mgnify:CR=1 FL=1